MENRSVFDNLANPKNWKNPLIYLHKVILYLLMIVAKPKCLQIFWYGEIGIVLIKIFYRVGAQIKSRWQAFSAYQKLAILFYLPDPDSIQI